MATAKAKFPKELYVTIERPPQGPPVFEARETPADFGDDADGEPIAIYERKDVKTMQVTKVLT